MIQINISFLEFPQYLIQRGRITFQNNGNTSSDIVIIGSKPEEKDPYQTA
jgi:hypothetical protein